MRALAVCSVMLAAGCSPAQSTLSAPAEAAVRAVRPGSAAANGWLDVRAAAIGRLLPPEHRLPAPDVGFVGGHGQAITLKQFEGRVVLLNLWATWCAPCVREMPSLDRLAADGSTLAVVPVSMDLQAPSAARYLERHGLANLVFYHDPGGELMRRFGAHGLPASFVIDREGRIAAVVHGAVDWTSDAMRELLAGV